MRNLNFQFCRCCIFSLNGGALGEKVCNQQPTYCSHGGARELRDQPAAITLQYERKGNIDVNLRFKYQLYGKKYWTICAFFYLFVCWYGIGYGQGMDGQKQILLVGKFYKMVIILQYYLHKFTKFSALLQCIIVLNLLWFIGTNTHGEFSKY